MRRLEDKIRELCGAVASCPDPELASTLSKLELALFEYMRRIQNKSAAAVFGWPDFPRERRVADKVSAIVLALQGSSHDVLRKRDQDLASRDWKKIAEEASHERDSGRLLSTFPRIGRRF